MAGVEKFGMPGTEFEGVFFTESPPPPGTQVLREVTAKRNRQNSNLTEIKSSLAQQAVAVGANAVVLFRYGQRAHKWWEQAFTFRWDSEAWYGEGKAVQLPISDPR